MPVVLDVVARTCSPEVFLLAVVATCFGTAYLTALAGVGSVAGGEATTDHVVIVGWGPTALDLAATLREADVQPVLMTTMNPDGAAQAEAGGTGCCAGTP